MSRRSATQYPLLLGWHAFTVNDEPDSYDHVGNDRLCVATALPSKVKF